MFPQVRLEEIYDNYTEHFQVATDSRNVSPGSVFFALKGDNFDGNRFAIQALAAGARCAVVDDAGVAYDYMKSHGAMETASTIIVVTDVLETLQALASYHRQRLGIPVLAITGTNGKTTTKELAAQVLGSKYNVYATAGNLNNHIGVPLTLLSVLPGTDMAIVEMGASARGEIALLCSIAQPDYGLITNIGRAHLEGFGGEEGVMAAKGELYDYLAAHGGTAIARSDDGVLREMAARRQGLNVKYYQSTLGDDIKSNLTGDYNRLNVAAAVAIGELFGVGDSDIRSAIESYTPSNNRSQRVDTGRNVLLADCYNANPSSMDAAINNFGVEGAPSEVALEKLMILGDMRELGEWSGPEHERVARLALGSDSEVWFVGTDFAQALQKLEKEGLSTTSAKVFSDAASVVAYLKENPVRGRYILLKGSRGVALERVIPSL